MIRHECATDSPRMKPLGLRVDAELIANALADIEAHPGVWNRITARTAQKSSPHREADDIWVRFNDPKNFDPANPPAFIAEHESVWYPEADVLPHIRALITVTAALLGAKTTGGVLVTRVPAGKQIHWHVDNGWHAEAHRKFLVLLKGNAEQSFEFADERLFAEPGDCFEFDNLYAHRVMNPTNEDRISLIICLRDFK